MAEFINTIDVLGDDAVIDSIIDRTITEFKDDKLTSIGSQAFNSCTALKTVDFPNLTEMSGSTADGYYFTNCTALEEVSMPLLKKINGRDAFNGCKGLTKVDFLPSAEVIGDYAFRYCSNITEATLPKLSGCGNGFFMSCSNLRKVDLPVVTTMGGPFESCKNLVALIIRTPTVCTWKVSWGLPPTIMTTKTGYIYVPRALIEDYKAATNWSTVATQFRALEDYTVDGTTTGDLDETKI